jgi:hypothetical protein
LKHRTQNLERRRQQRRNALAAHARNRDCLQFDAGLRHELGLEPAFAA